MLEAFDVDFIAETNNYLHFLVLLVDHVNYCLVYKYVLFLHFLNTDLEAVRQLGAVF